MDLGNAFTFLSFNYVNDIRVYRTNYIGSPLFLLIDLDIHNSKSE